MKSSTLSVIYTAAVGFLLIAAAAKQRCRRRRHYLTRCTLPPYLDSAWRHVLRSKDDKAFIHTTGFDMATFRFLLSGFQPLWQRKTRRGRPPTVLAVDALGLTLQYLNSSTPLKALCQVFAMPPATLSLHLRRGMCVLLQFVSRNYHCRVRWPTPLEIWLRNQRCRSWFRGFNRARRRGRERRLRARRIIAHSCSSHQSHVGDASVDGKAARHLLRSGLEAALRHACPAFTSPPRPKPSASISR
jgi:hypothetical protein